MVGSLAADRSHATLCLPCWSVGLATSAVAAWSVYVLVLQVLYNFLVEFSNFDWDHYCLSLTGPVPLKDLPSAAGRAAQTTRAAATGHLWRAPYPHAAFVCCYCHPHRQLQYAQHSRGQNHSIGRAGAFARFMIACMITQPVLIALSQPVTVSLGARAAASEGFCWSSVFAFVPPCCLQWMPLWPLRARCWSWTAAWQTPWHASRPRWPAARARPGHAAL